MYLSNSLKKRLFTNEISALNTKVNASRSKAFDDSITLSGYILKAHKWFKDAEGVEFIKESGLKFEGVILEVYGFQKSFYYKLLKTAQAIDESPEVLTEFKKQCDELKKAGKNVAYSIENFLSFVKASATENKEGESEEGESEEGAKVKTKMDTIFTLVFKGETKVNLRIESDGVLHTTNTLDEINKAIEFLSKCALESLTPKQAPKPKKAKKGLKLTDAVVLNEFDEIM